MPEAAMEEQRQAREGPVAARRTDIGRAIELADIADVVMRDLAMNVLVAGIVRKLEIDAFGLDDALTQRTRAFVVADHTTELQLRHDRFLPGRVLLLCDEVARATRRRQGGA